MTISANVGDQIFSLLELKCIIFFQKLALEIALEKIQTNFLNPKFARKIPQVRHLKIVR